MPKYIHADAARDRSAQREYDEALPATAFKKWGAQAPGGVFRGQGRGGSPFKISRVDGRGHVRMLPLPQGKPQGCIRKPIGLGHQGPNRSLRWGINAQLPPPFSRGRAQFEMYCRLNSCRPCQRACASAVGWQQIPRAGALTAMVEWPYMDPSSFASTPFLAVRYDCSRISGL